jgi:heme oxygenase
MECDAKLSRDAGQDQSTGPTDLRELLRGRTRNAHERLDSSIGALDLSQRTSYERFLRGTASALAPIELALEESGVEALLPDWPRRRRRQALQDDLSLLGSAFQPLPPLRPLERSELFGALYVLEGSRLGARIIRKRVTQSADPLVRKASAYLSLGDADLWPRFLRLLKTCRNVDGERAAAAATMVFAMFEEGFRRA